MKYVGYYRVSTKKQSKSGLGLEAQQDMVRQFVAAHGSLVGEFGTINVLNWQKR